MASEKSLEELTSELTQARAELKAAKLRNAALAKGCDAGQADDIALRAFEGPEATRWDEDIHTAEEYLHNLWRKGAPHLSPGYVESQRKMQEARNTPIFRKYLKPEQASALITELGQAGYLALPYDETEAAKRAPKRDASGRFTGTLRRSLLSPKEKAAYITAHGAEAFLKLPWN
jgi:hypothetical protein